MTWVEHLSIPGLRKRSSEGIWGPAACPPVLESSFHPGPALGPEPTLIHSKAPVCSHLPGSPLGFPSNSDFLSANPHQLDKIHVPLSRPQISPQKSPFLLLEWSRTPVRFLAMAICLFSLNILSAASHILPCILHPKSFSLGFRLWGWSSPTLHLCYDQTATPWLAN